MTDNPIPGPGSTGAHFIAAAAGTAIASAHRQRRRQRRRCAQAAAGCRPAGRCDVAVNGASKSLTLDARTTLLDALREHIGLTGSKKGCDHGQCGACTVLIDGRRVLSCLTLALAAQDQQITTIEGLAKRRQAASDAAGLYRPGCLPVRLLHAGTDHVGGGLRERRAMPTATTISANI